MTYEVRAATSGELKLFYETVTLPDFEVAHGLFIGGKMVAVSGILTDPSHGGTFLDDVSPLIGFLDIAPGLNASVGFDIARRLRGFLREQNRTVFVQQNDSYPQADKLLRAIGFKPTHIMRKDLQNPNSNRKLRMWIWQG